MRAVAVGVAFLAGCVATQSPGNHTSEPIGSGGETGEGGSGGEGGYVGDVGGSAGAGGTVEGGGGQFGEDAMAEGVEQEAALGYVATELACAGSALYWFNEATRKVMRASNGHEEEVFAVDGEGDVMLRPAGDRVMVSLLGSNGAVWMVGTEGVAAVADGPLRYAAFGDDLPHWYDGESIRTPDGVVATPDQPVVAFAAYDEGPIFLAQDNSVYKVKGGDVFRVGSAPDDYYANTFTTAGATAAWGSRSGLRMMLLSGGDPFTFGFDVRALSSGPSGLFICETTATGSRISYFEPIGKLVTVTTHGTCTSITECGEHVYWSTERGNILRVASKARTTD